MIREGTLEDIPALLAFGMPFVRLLPGPPREPDEDACRQYLEKFIAAEHGALFVSERDGRVTAFICGVCVDDPFTNERVGLKSSWIVNPEFPGDGGRLMLKLESWAREQGADRMIVSHLTKSLDPDIAKFFEARGYVRTEHKYERML